MRSRTELVTTTFIDSEEDETETDDSEEDWKPDTSSRSSGSGKQQQQHKTKLQRGKRKSNNLTKKSQSTSSMMKKRKIEATTFESEPDCDDGDDYGSNHYNNTNNSGIGITNYCQQNVASFQNVINTNAILKKDKPLSQKVVAEQSMPDKSGIFQLYLYKKDLNKDYRTSPNLCLWRRDGSSLLQKYIRIKTPNSEEFIFTSSSVYSSWDERRRKDFVILAVKCLEENNRRVTILNISDLHALAEDVIRQKQLKIENIEEEEDSTDDEMVTYDSQDDEDDDDDDDDNDRGGSCNDYGGDNDDSSKDHKDHQDSEQNKDNKNINRSLNDDVCSNENTK